MLTHRPVCLDASFLVQLLTQGVYVVKAANLWREWHIEEQDLVAPILIYYEISNALHRYVRYDKMSLQDARKALDSVFAFSITTYQDYDLHRSALKLANLYRLPASYDAHYLALAQRLGAEVWTADRRLVNAVQDSLSWVRFLGA